MLFLTASSACTSGTKIVVNMAMRMESIVHHDKRNPTEDCGTS